MYRFETIDLGTYRDCDYFLTEFVEPEPVAGEDYDPDRDAHEYGVTLARSNEYGSNAEIVRMDTTHGRPHLDRLYLPLDIDEERKVWLDHGYSYTRMKQYLLANWRRFASLSLRYERSRPDE